MTESRDSNEASIERREFLKTGTLAGAAALLGPAGVSEAQAQAGAETAEQSIRTPIMTAEAEAISPADVQVIGTDERSGSDGARRDGRCAV